MRIISGRFKGKKLSDSSHLKLLRPTTDSNRESLFNILTSGKIIKEIGFKIEGAKILDICCGSGSVGLECLSRGAKSAFFIDNNFKHLEIAKKNSQILQVEESCQFLLSDAKIGLNKTLEKFDLVFIDPPYNENYLEIITNLKEKEWITPESLIVIEFKTFKEKQLKDCGFLQQLELRKYGGTSFLFANIVK